MIEGKREMSLEHVKQYYVLVEKSEFRSLYLADLLDILDYLKGIIYVNKEELDVVSNLLIERGYSYISIKSSMNYFDCCSEIQKFLKGLARFLISNKPISYYGQDMETKIVINYNFPLTPREYMQRVGAYGRISQTRCINFTDFNEFARLQKVEEYYNTKIDEHPEDINNIFC